MRDIFEAIDNLITIGHLQPFVTSENLNEWSRNGETPLHYAVRTLNTKAVSQLLEYAELDVNKKDCTFHTPLSVAIQNAISFHDAISHYANTPTGRESEESYDKCKTIIAAILMRCPRSYYMKAGSTMPFYLDGRVRGKQTNYIVETTCFDLTKECPDLFAFIQKNMAAQTCYSFWASPNVRNSYRDTDLFLADSPSP